MTGLLLRSLIIGFSIAAPVGPIGVLCIRRTLAFGRVSGLVSGLGAATADACYGSLAALGLAAATNLLIAQQNWLRLFGGLFLCYLGLRTLLEPPATLSPLYSVSLQTRPTRQLWGDYLSTLALTLTNPLTILSFIAIFTSLGVATSQLNQGLLVVAGVFLGSATWWLMLSSIASVLRQRFLTPGGLRWINRLSGLIILGFGLGTLISLAINLLP